MGNVLFGVDIAAIVNSALSNGLLDATLIKVTQGARPAPDEPPAVTTASYTAKGFIDVYSDRVVDGTLIRQEDRKVTLLGDSISSGAVPEQGDSITIEGVTLLIVGPVKRDPAGATYECQCRGS